MRENSFARQRERGRERKWSLDIRVLTINIVFNLSSIVFPFVRLPLSTFPFHFIVISLLSKDHIFYLSIQRSYFQLSINRTYFQLSINRTSFLFALFFFVDLCLSAFWSVSVWPSSVCLVHKFFSSKCFYCCGTSFRCLFPLNPSQQTTYLLSKQKV